MGVEERRQLNMHEENEVYYCEEILVRACLSPVWAGLVSYVEKYSVTALPGFTATACEARRLMDDKVKHDQTKGFPNQHIWDEYGKE